MPKCQVSSEYLSGVRERSGKFEQNCQVSTSDWISLDLRRNHYGIRLSKWVERDLMFFSSNLSLNQGLSKG